jgi:site-specific recombinase XerD
VSTDDILDFMAKFTEGLKPQTKRIRFSHLTAFFNFMRNNFDCDFINPCDSPMLRKLFRPKANVHWDIIEKDTVDEIIFRTDNIRNRLMLELMARGGMRVGEVLKLTPADVLGRKLILNDTKSGKEQELIFIPQKVADRLKEYVRVPKNCTEADDFSDLLWSSQSNGGKSRQIGWNTVEATRSATSCGNVRIPFKCSFRDNFESNFTTFEPFDHRNLFGKGQ